MPPPLRDKLERMECFLTLNPAISPLHHTLNVLTEIINCLLFPLFSSRFLPDPPQSITRRLKMPALDLDMIGRLGRDLHTTSHTGLMAEDEVCPWTLFLTMALTLLKGS